MIEVDGSRHRSEMRQRLDRERDAHLRAQGFRVLRITEYQAQHHSHDIADQVWALVHGHPLPPAPGEEEEYEGPRPRHLTT